MYFNKLQMASLSIDLASQASMDISGIKGIWSLRQSLSSAFDSYLVQSFMAETRVLAICEEELSEVRESFSLRVVLTIFYFILFAFSW